MLLQIRQKLERAEKIALFGHEYIDGDALGAILGLGAVLEKMGKAVSYFTPHAPSRIFSFLNRQDKVETSFDYAEYDVLVFLDFNGYGRISPFTIGHESWFDQQEKIIIDHHQAEQEPPYTLIYRDTGAISTCGILYLLIKQWRSEYITPEVATYLYMGLSTDSGNFRYDEGQQSIETFEVAAELLRYGADKKRVIDEIFRNKSYESVEFMQLLLQRMQQLSLLQGSERFPDGMRLIYSFYEGEELERLDVDHDEADYALYIMQDIRPNDLVLLIKKVGIFVKVSLRSRGKIDCSSLARHFGGGGHKNAAGFKIQGSGFLQRDIEQIIQTLPQVL